MSLNWVSLTADDFEKQPHGPQLFDPWLAKECLESPLGRFEIEINQPPDEGLLRHVNDLATVVSNAYDAIQDAVYESYFSAAEDKRWMTGCGVPRRLGVHQVPRYLRSRAIVVRRDRRGRIIGTIFISPQWDVEHVISA